jgi:hypothetical protein
MIQGTARMKASGDNLFCSLMYRHIRTSALPTASFKHFPHFAYGLQALCEACEAPLFIVRIDLFPTTEKKTEAPSPNVP